MDESERAAVDFLRDKTSHLLTPVYDTDFNLLRWAIGYGFNLDEALLHLKRHLILRRFHNLDAHEDIPPHEILDEFFPLQLLGSAGPGTSNLLVAECAGSIDLRGILRSVQLSDFLLQRYAFQEKVRQQLNVVEARTGKQASAVYILDLAGLKLDSSLLSIVTGPYRILWEAVYTNYPEWISDLLVFNAPPFMSLIWKVLLPLLPERTRHKIHISSSASAAESLARTFVHPSCLPVQWGGELRSEGATGLLRERGPIPCSLFWQPSPSSPSLSQLPALSIPPGKAASATFSPTSLPAFILVNRFSERQFGMALWWSKGEEEEMEEWSPPFEYPAMPIVDCLRVPTPPSASSFRLQFSNHQAWFRSLEVRWRVIFEDEYQNEIPYTSQKCCIS